MVFSVEILLPTQLPHNNISLYIALYAVGAQYALT